MSYEYGSWKPYVPVAKRRAQAEHEIKKRAKGGTAMQPVRIAGRAIAKSFWGQGWCRHLETFSDFENRLPHRLTAGIAAGTALRASHGYRQRP